MAVLLWRFALSRCFLILSLQQTKKTRISAIADKPRGAVLYSCWGIAGFFVRKRKQEVHNRLRSIRCTGAITLNVVWMEREFDAYKLSRSMYLSIFNRFPVIQTTSAKFFVSHGDAPATITQYVASMERQFNAYQTPRSMYLSIFNSFRVIRCLSQCISPKIAI